MKVAIIENDVIYINSLKKISEDYLWEMDFFNNSEEFGKVSLKQYSVIIANQDLSTTKGRDLLKSVSEKTNAQLFLMRLTSEGNGFSKEDVLNGSISGLIDKSDPKNIIEQLKYIDSKLKINKIIEIENNKYDEII